MFHPWCFFSLGSRISEVPRPIAAKLCHMIAIWRQSRAKVGQLWGSFPKKILGAKNMQNFGRFFATSDFDCEYLLNDLRYPNSNSKFFYSDSSCVPGNTSRELWSTTFTDLNVRLDALKITFGGYHISALRRCCALKFLHALEIDQGYLAHTSTGTGVPQKIVIVKIKNRV